MSRLVLVRFGLFRLGLGYVRLAFLLASNNRSKQRHDDKGLNSGKFNIVNRKFEVEHER